MTTMETQHERTWTFQHRVLRDLHEALDEPLPWDGEPDKVQWVDPATDLDCLIVRNRMGNLCGYVGLPPSHPLHGTHYGDIEDISVHGGLTYSDKCQEGDVIEGVCHIPERGRPADLWWLGFDACHITDWSPNDLFMAVQFHFAYPFLDPRRDEPDQYWKRSYKTVGYMRGECTALASQLKALA